MLRNIFLPVLLLISHYGYLYMRNFIKVQESILLSAMYLFHYEFIFWTLCFIFQFFDKNFPEHQKKLKSKNKEKYTFNEMLPFVIVNHVVQFCIWSLMFHLNLRNDYSESLGATIIWFVAVYIAFAATFYFGHFAEHKFQWLKPTHVLHHETFAISGLSGHCMTLFDFFFQSIFGGCAGILLFNFGCSPMALLAFASYGIFNTVVVHSGWDIEFLPDPKIHFLHHSKYNVNYGCGIFDDVFNTASRSF